MEKRRFGRTGHMSTVAIFGAAAFWEIEQKEADKVMEMVIESGVNHIDVAPSYGQAELRIGPWMPRERERFFLGCKTMERTKGGAMNELGQSLNRLQTDHFDLYQLHAITCMEELDACTMKGGALEALVEARQRGLTRHIGITGHGVDSPRVFIEALKRFEFDSILFPLNFVQMANPEYRKDAETLIALCKEKNVGTMVIKTVTKGPWGDKEKTATTWYEPFDQMEQIQEAVNFALSYEVTGLCTAGDVNVLPMVLEASQNFSQLSQSQREAMIQSGDQFEPLFT
ncbi:MAG: aldo/keto reductase [Anaerolineales bacterium]|jgi:aryl-alcohol dehydrogenase-like predicted oxidoreductase